MRVEASLRAGGAGCGGRPPAVLAEVWTRQADASAGTMGLGQIDWVKKGGVLQLMAQLPGTQEEAQV